MIKLCCGKKVTANQAAKVIVATYGANAVECDITRLLAVDLEKATEKEIEEVRKCCVRHIDRLRVFLGLDKIEG